MEWGIAPVRLWFATQGDEEFLVLIDVVGVGDGGIGGGEAGPGRGSAQMGLREVPQRVALADFDRRRGAVPVMTR